MKIGEVARRVGVSVSTLRLYEQRGLIAADRSPGGTRHYGEEDLDRFRAIVSMTRAEIGIEELARLACVRPAHSSGDAASRQVEEILGRIEADLVERIAHLQEILDDLRVAQVRLGGCHGCHRRPTREECDGCPVADDLLACPVMRIVWDQKPSDA